MTTIMISADEVRRVIDDHRVVGMVGGVVLCRCRQWFDNHDEHTEHLFAELDDLDTTRRRNRRITDELLVQVAETYRNAAPRDKTPAVNRLLGFKGGKGNKAGWYINQARKRGLLEWPDGEIRKTEEGQ